MGDSEIDADAVVDLLAPEGKLRIVVAVLEESGDEFNPARIYEHDGVSKDAWYRYRDDLEAAGLLEEAGSIGNSPLYRVPDGPIANNLRAAFEGASN